MATLKNNSNLTPSGYSTRVKERGTHFSELSAAMIAKLSEVSAAVRGPNRGQKNFKKWPTTLNKNCVIIFVRTQNQNQMQWQWGKGEKWRGAESALNEPRKYGNNEPISDQLIGKKGVWSFQRF